MSVFIFILYHVQLYEFQEFPISANLKHFDLNWVHLIHFKAPDKADLHSIASMECWAIDADEYTVVDGAPLRVFF